MLTEKLTATGWWLELSAFLVITYDTDRDFPPSLPGDGPFGNLPIVLAVLGKHANRAYRRAISREVVVPR